ncbi:MAG: hypothetical protein ACKVQC_09130 [Elusimicrobiota bacterium]
MRASISLCSLLLTITAFAVDHNNIDLNRPLSFEDAESIARYELSYESGIHTEFPRHGKTGVSIPIEISYGAFLNSHFSIGFDPGWGNIDEFRDSRFNFNRTEVSYFHNLNRELLNFPAVAFKLGAGFPSGKNQKEMEYLVKAIFSKRFFEFERVHLNSISIYRAGSSFRERKWLHSAILGLTHPLGYPKKFVSTALANIGIRESEIKGQKPMGKWGIGIRRQISIRSVIDLGFKGDIPFESRNSYMALGFNLGLSTAF